MDKRQTRQSGAPLSMQQYIILGQLRDGGAMHGWGITEEIARATEGKMLLGAGTLYENLKKMVREGYIERVEDVDIEDGKRRKFYKIMALGEQVFDEHARMLEAATRRAAYLGRPSIKPA